jgi:hypothetical protein
VIWLHPEGKETILKQNLLEELVNSGFAVISADLPGTGELHDPEFSGDGIIKGVPFNYTFGANLVGKSITGIKTEAFDLLIQFIKEDQRFSNPDLFALAQGTTVSEVIHYSILKDPFKKIIIVDSPATSEEIFNNKHYDPVQAFSKVPGSLLYYDLPDLISQIPSGRVKTCINESGNEVISDTKVTKEIKLFFESN